MYCRYWYIYNYEECQEQIVYLDYYLLEYKCTKCSNVPIMLTSMELCKLKS